LVGGGQRAWGKAIRDILFYASASLPYYLLLRFYYMPTYAVEQRVPPSYVTELTLWSVIGGVVKLVALLDAMANFWNIYPLPGALVVLAIIFALARIAADVRNSLAIDWVGGRGAGKLLLLLVLFGAVNIVFILSPVGLVYRLMVAQSAVLLFWLFTSLLALLEVARPGSGERAQRPLAFAIVAIAALFASHTMSESVFQSALER